MKTEVMEAFANMFIGSAFDIPAEHRVKPEEIIEMANMVRYFPYGTPCKATHTGFGVVGRYVGNAYKGSGSGDKDGNTIWSIILFATPGGTIITTGRCHVRFELTEDELKTLEYYETDAKNTESKEWYHKNKAANELDTLGEFMNWEDIVPV